MKVKSLTQTWMPLSTLMEGWRPGSSDATGWNWLDEAADLWTRPCACCERYGHHQFKLAQYMAEHSKRTWPFDYPILLGDDGRVWDGHHRIVAAWMLGQDKVLVDLGRTPG